ncbi:MAG: hypothetical protein WDM77_18375 [Steroidobacteraceae bacterium]
MATIEDRSGLRVSVPKHRKLTRYFLYSKAKAARAYLNELREKNGHKDPEITSKED